jgi:hypothetical protein
MSGPLFTLQGARPSASTSNFAGSGDAGDGGPTFTGAHPFATASEWAGSGVARDGGPRSTGASQAQTADGVCWFYADGKIGALDLATMTVVESFPSEHAWFGVGNAALLVGTEVVDRHGTRKARLALGGLKADTLFLHTRSIDDAGTVAVGTRIDEFFLWDACTGKRLHRETIAKLDDVAVDPQGRTVAIARWGKPLQLLDLQTLTKRTVEGWSPQAACRFVGPRMQRGSSLSTATKRSSSIRRQEFAWEVVQGIRPSRRTARSSSE